LSVNKKPHTTWSRPRDTSTLCFSVVHFT